MQAKSKHELMKNGAESIRNNKMTDVDSMNTAERRRSKAKYKYPKGGYISSASKGQRGGIDSSANEETAVRNSSERDLFFSALSAQVGVNKGRP